MEQLHDGARDGGPKSDLDDLEDRIQGMQDQVQEMQVVLRNDAALLQAAQRLVKSGPPATAPPQRPALLCGSALGQRGRAVMRDRGVQPISAAALAQQAGADERQSHPQTHAECLKRAALLEDGRDAGPSDPCSTAGEDAELRATLKFCDENGRYHKDKRTHATRQLNDEVREAVEAVIVGVPAKGVPRLGVDHGAAQHAVTAVEAQLRSSNGFAKSRIDEMMAALVQDPALVQATEHQWGPFTSRDLSGLDNVAWQLYHTGPRRLRAFYLECVIYKHALLAGVELPWLPHLVPPPAKHLTNDLKGLTYAAQHLAKQLLPSRAYLGYRTFVTKLINPQMKRSIKLAHTNSDSDMEAGSLEGCSYRYTRQQQDPLLDTMKDQLTARLPMPKGAPSRSQNPARAQDDHTHDASLGMPASGTPGRSLAALRPAQPQQTAAEAQTSYDSARERGTESANRSSRSEAPPESTSDGAASSASQRSWSPARGNVDPALRASDEECRSPPVLARQARASDHPRPMAGVKQGPTTATGSHGQAQAALQLHECEGLGSAEAAPRCVKREPAPPDGKALQRARCKGRSEAARMCDEQPPRKRAQTEACQGAIDDEIIIID